MTTRPEQLTPRTGTTPARVEPPAPSPPPSPPTERATEATPERVTWVDWVMLALAVLTLSLLIVEQTFAGFFQANPELRRWLFIFDTSICGVFLIEFLARMRRAPDKWGYVKSRWYEILGMVPVSHPFFRAFRSSGCCASS